MFEGDDDGLGLNSGLMIAKPVSNQSNNWLKNAVAWTISPQRDAVWALTTEGHLCRTSTKRKNWQIVRRNALSQTHYVLCRRHCPFHRVVMGWLSVMRLEEAASLSSRRHHNVRGQLVGARLWVK
jgi:hypothetical protein